MPLPQKHIFVLHNIYAFSRRFYPKQLTVHSGYIFSQYVCSLGIEPTTFCVANAMLYHWATGIHRVTQHNVFKEFVCTPDASFKTAWRMQNEDCLLRILQTETSFDLVLLHSLDMQPYKDVSFCLKSTQSFADGNGKFDPFLKTCFRNLFLQTFRQFISMNRSKLTNKQLHLFNCAVA